MEKPSIGDTVIIKGVIKSFSSMGATAHIDTGTFRLGLLTCSVERIAEVIPKPWEPKVGDTVWLSEGHTPYRGYTILCIQNQDNRPERAWAVVAYLSDIPKVVLLHTVLQHRPE